VEIVFSSEIISRTNMSFNGASLRYATLYERVNSNDRIAVIVPPSAEYLVNSSDVLINISVHTHTHTHTHTQIHDLHIINKHFCGLLHLVVYNVNNASVT